DGLQPLPGCGGAGERLARRPAGAQTALPRLAGRVPRSLGALRGGGRSDQRDRVPHPAGRARRDAAGDVHDDPVPDRHARHRQVGTAMGLYGLGMVVAPASGPTLGGYLVEYASWRLVYFINV